MRPQYLLASLCLSLVFVTSACSGGGDDDGSTPPPSFSGDSFVIDAVQHTSDTSEPVAINGQNLTFSEDPHAFDAVLH